MWKRRRIQSQSTDTVWENDLQDRHSKLRLLCQTLLYFTCVTLGNLLDPPDVTFTYNISFYYTRSVRFTVYNMPVTQGASISENLLLFDAATAIAINVSIILFPQVLVLNSVIFIKHTFENVIVFLVNLQQLFVNYGIRFGFLNFSLFFFQTLWDLFPTSFFQPLSSTSLHSGLGSVSLLSFFEYLMFKVFCTCAFADVIFLAWNAFFCLPSLPYQNLFSSPRLGLIFALH